MVLYANTRAEWMISAIGAFKHSLAIVTIYTNLGEEGVQHGITQVNTCSLNDLIEFYNFFTAD